MIKSLPEKAILDVDKLRDEGWTQFIIILENGINVYFDDMQGTVQNISEKEVESYTSARKVRI